ncbi:MAG TPA: 4Fe-4S dicluster domain-containing protein [Candidatus Eisenbacteria bacterium]|nr:4Fe-4S dicluster domain-containing protein [Candidatus Eisenbacteria bacterium]
MNRRGFLKTLGLAGATVVCPRTSGAAEPSGGAGEPYGVLVDTTRCVGCNTCTSACAEANGLPEPEDPEAVTRPTTTQWTAIGRYKTSKGEVFAKHQCMHCVSPACHSACLTAAMEKTARGPVVWREDKCMGCRFCMISCPFDGPKFEYSSTNPRIRKCVMCAERIAKGQQPACVDNCPEGALTFGKRNDLLREAHKRIGNAPDQYVDHVYGEREAGGTSWLYLASVGFEEIGFPANVGESSYPMLTAPFLYSVPFVLTLAPTLLTSVARAVRKGEEPHDGEASNPAGGNGSAPAPAGSPGFEEEDAS